MRVLHVELRVDHPVPEATLLATGSTGGLGIAAYPPGTVRMCP